MVINTTWAVQLHKNNKALKLQNSASVYQTSSSNVYQESFPFPRSIKAVQLFGKRSNISTKFILIPSNPIRLRILLNRTTPTLSTSFSPKKSENLGRNIHLKSMAKSEELPVPIFSSLEPVYGTGSQLEEAELRFAKLKSKFVEFFGHPPVIYARSPGYVYSHTNYRFVIHLYWFVFPFWMFFFFFWCV